MCERACVPAGGRAVERVVSMQSYMRACLCVCVSVYLLKVN